MSSLLSDPSISVNNLIPIPEHVMNERSHDSESIAVRMYDELENISDTFGKSFAQKIA